MPYAKAQTTQAQTSQPQHTTTSCATARIHSHRLHNHKLYKRKFQAQSGGRKAKLNTPPEYPELARKLNIQGAARVLLTVAPDGKVGNVKELGGNRSW